jgi:hypothetical protein
MVATLGVIGASVGMSRGVIRRQQASRWDVIRHHQRSIGPSQRIVRRHNLCETTPLAVIMPSNSIPYRSDLRTCPVDTGG